MRAKKTGGATLPTFDLHPLGKIWVPLPEYIPKLIIQDTGADLQQQVGTLLASAHLLFFDHPLAHKLVNGRFHKGCGEGLAISLTLNVIWNNSSVIPNLGLEIFELFKQCYHLCGRLFSVTIHG